MNFLGHAYFNNGSSERLLGNIMGDFVKGNISHYPLTLEMQEGVKLHRKIDSLCDNAASFLRMKRLFAMRFGHYRGVIVDIILDHFLAKYFLKFSNISLEVFSQNCYEQIEQYTNYFTSEFKKVFFYMKRDNFLLQNLDIKNILELLKSIERRSRHAQGITDSYAEFLDKYEEFEGLFFEFMNEMSSLGEVKT